MSAFGFDVKGWDDVTKNNIEDLIKKHLSSFELFLVNGKHYKMAKLISNVTTYQYVDKRCFLWQTLEVNGVTSRYSQVCYVDDEFRKLIRGGMSDIEVAVAYSYYTKSTNHKL